MAGKAKPTAKKPTATAKKPTATAKKPTATAKKPTATAKKPTATAKKPTTRFNLNKLIMLIGRNPQKKGKKMIGGYGTTHLNNIKVTLMEFFNQQQTKEKVRKFIRDYYDDNNAGHHITTKKFVKNNYRIYGAGLDDTNFKNFIEFMNGSIINEPYEALSNDIIDGTFDNKNFTHVKKIFTLNYMLIIKTLCNIYFSLYNHTELTPGETYMVISNIPAANDVDIEDTAPW